MPNTVAELVSLFDLDQTGDLAFIGPHPNTLFQRLFGGQVLAQTLVAAMRTVPTDRVVHSLNAYFLRPGTADQPLRFEVDVLRDGRSFSTRRVTTLQHGKPIFALTASFQEPEEGLAHSTAEPADVTPPEDSRPLKEVMRDQFGANPLFSEWDALDVRLASPGRQDEGAATMRAWVRTAGPMPDDPVLHAAVLAYLSDITLLSVATVPHEVEFLSPNLQAASIDHAMWFHRPVRVDQWLLYDMVSPSASGARGFSQGRLFQNGVAVASCAQEGLIRVLG